MKKFRGYIICFICGVAILLTTLLFKGTFVQEDSTIVIKDLTDCFFFTSVYLIGYGLLVVVSNEGFFDGLVYTGKKIVLRFRPMEERKLVQSYFEYKQSVKDQKTEYGFILIVGSVFLVLSIIFLIIYYIL